MAIPQTPFEARGKVAPWTTRPEEESWIAAFTAEAPHVGVEVVGQAAGGGPMRLFTFGSGPNVILHIAQQHGSELAGRDVMLSYMRRLAAGDDPELVDYLASATVLIMPTCHPDNLTTRENVNGIDVNRDHLALRTPEAQTIQKVITDHVPDVIVDWHEGNITAISTQVATSYNIAENTPPAVRDLSLAIHQQVRADCLAAGLTWQLYGGSVSRDPDMLRTLGGLRGAVTFLVETQRTYGDDSDAAGRHARQMVMLESVWRWHHAHGDAARTAATAGRASLAARTDRIVLQKGYSATGPTIEPIPDRYLLDAAQVATTAPHRATFGIASQPSGSGRVVPMAQPGQTLIAYLVDEASADYGVVQATRVYDEPPSPPKPLRNLPDRVLYDVANAYETVYTLGGARWPAEFVYRPT